MYDVRFIGIATVIVPVDRQQDPPEFHVDQRYILGRHQQFVQVSKCL